MWLYITGQFQKSYYICVLIIRQQYIMHKNKLFKLVFKLLIVLFSYGYIYYKFKVLKVNWHEVDHVNLVFFLFALVLMPFNWLIESFKWQYLLKDIQQVPLKKAIRGIAIGITSGMATPNRIGEYVGRTFVLYKNNRVKGSLATMLGSLSQVLITLMSGMLGWIVIFEKVHFFENLLYRPFFIIALFILMAVMLLVFYHLQWIKRLAKWLSINQRYIDELRFLSKFKASELSFVLFLSFFRYVVFAIQYVLLLWAFGLNIPLLYSLSAIAVIYLIIVFIPHFTITELGVRGSIAVLVFQNFTNQLQLVALAAGVLWLINIAVPTLIGSALMLSKSSEK